MANNFRNPWVLDTASATPLKGGGKTLVKGVIFKDYSSAAHKCIFKDGAGRVVIELWGAADLSPVGYSRDGCLPWDGLTLDTLGSGVAVVDVA